MTASRPAIGCPLAAAKLAERGGVDAVVALGAVVQGATSLSGSATGAAISPAAMFIAPAIKGFDLHQGGTGSVPSVICGRDGARPSQ